METNAKIIVVDDEKGICQNVAKILSRSNYEVACALSAKEALDRMAKEPFAMLISDVVMPEMNGLELLKQVHKRYPDTRTLVMTAYPSTDTALKSIRLGASDYLPKPFTPDELRQRVADTLRGELMAAPAPEDEMEDITLIDVDMPFDAGEVAKAAGQNYVDTLGPSDMPVVQVNIEAKAPAHFCGVGEMVCDIFRKLGATCKAGTKSGACPQKKAGKTEGKAAKADPAAPHPASLVGIDMPFSYQEVISVTGPEYVSHLHHEGVAFVPYEQLKRQWAAVEGKTAGTIDVDMPFDREQVAQAVGEAYVERLGPSDMPVVEISAAAVPQHFCQVGEMVCDIFRKLGGTCKVGTKSGACPQKKAGQRAGTPAGKIQDASRLVGVDMPFDYEELVAAVGADYAANLQPDGFAPTSYESLKARYGKVTAGQAAEAILVIDDEVEVNNSIRKALSRKGYVIDQAVSKQEALAAIAAKPYKAVMLDLRMPGVNGLELLKAVRKQQPKARVVIVTGYASIETAVETARLGAVGYLAKPFTPKEIRGAAESALRRAA
jgi:DNA-binding response OmpR family regulator